jgi:hypothetical protein
MTDEDDDTRRKRKRRRPTRLAPLVLSEVSVVDRGANEHAKIMILKRKERQMNEGHLEQ